MLAGTAGFEDAGVYRLDDERALVQTTDFFPPIVDDPRWFGRIAAANSLSDVYAMGGVVLTALNIVGWPKDLDVEILGEVLAGGMDKIREAGAALCGGHSVVDQEIKYGLAVTGLVHPERFWRNSGAQQGDVLLLTKPVGMGPISTGIKRGATTASVAAAAMEQMAMLNKVAMEVLLDFTVHAATDVTGFGLVGHAEEMAAGAKLSLRIDTSAVPLIEGALELGRAGVFSGGADRGIVAYAPVVEVGSGVDATRVKIFHDAETSGGLLVALPADQATRAEQALTDAGAPCAAVIGEFAAPAERTVVLA